jgi:hypothetical protein
MRASLLLLAVSAVLNWSATSRAQDYGSPYGYYRGPGSFASPGAADYGNPYRYYRAPSYYDSTRPPDAFDYNEHRRETLQYLYRHQLVPHIDAPRRRVLPTPSSEPLPRYRSSYRSYYYSSPYFYYRSPSSYGSTSRSYSDGSLRYPRR